MKEFLEEKQQSILTTEDTVPKLEEWTEKKSLQYTEFAEGAMELLGVCSGGVIGIVDKKKKIVYEKAFGTKAIDSNELVTTDNTNFPIASMTKSLTALLGAIVVEMGNILPEGWDTLVKDILPEFDLKNSRLAKELTIRRMLAMNVGYDNFPIEWMFTLDDAAKFMQAMRKMASPDAGTGEMRYSESLSTFGGYAIAKAWFNKTYPRRIVSLELMYEIAMQELIFKPLEMKNTVITFKKALQLNPGPALPHRLDLDGKLKRNSNSLEDIDDKVAPSGAVVPTLKDFLNVIELLLHDGMFKGKQIISKEAIQELLKALTFRPYGNGGPGRLGLPWGGGLDGGMRGLGFNLDDEEVPNVELIGAPGGSAGFTSDFHYFQLPNGEGRGMTIYMNGLLSTFGGALVYILKLKYLELTFPHLEPRAAEMLREAKKQKVKFISWVGQLVNPEATEWMKALKGSYKEDRLGESRIYETNDGYIRFRCKAFEARLGSGKDDEGKTFIYFLDPPVYGVPMSVVNGRLHINMGQEQYSFKQVALELTNVVPSTEEALLSIRSALTAKIKMLKEEKEKQDILQKNYIGFFPVVKENPLICDIMILVKSVVSIQKILYKENISPEEFQILEKITKDLNLYDEHVFSGIKPKKSVDLKEETQEVGFKNETTIKFN